MIKRDYSSLNALIEEANKEEKTFEKKDWTIKDEFHPTVVNGKATVVMRLLPSKNLEETMYIENKNHMHKLPNGKFFGCECLGKFGITCPICEYNRAVYKQFGKDKVGAKNASIASARSKYLTSVYIVKNDNNPETEGKVFHWQFGKQIMDIFKKAMKDTTDPETGDTINHVNPWELLENGPQGEGANFILEITPSDMGPTIPNYETSHFSDKHGRITTKVNGKLRPMTDAEIEALETQFVTYGEYYRTEADVMDNDTIIKVWEKKTNGDKRLRPYVQDKSKFEDDEVDFGTKTETASPSPVSFEETVAAAPSVATTTNEKDFFADLPF